MLTVIIFVLVFILCSVAAFFNPVFSFVVYELVYFFSPHERWWGGYLPGISYSFLTVILMFIVYFYHLKKLPVNKIAQAPQLIWMYLAILSYGIAYFYAVNQTGHSTAAINFIKLGIIITLAYKIVTNEKALNYVLWGYILGCFYVSYLIFQVGRNSGDRVEGIGTVDAPDANGIAAILAPSLVLLLYFFIFKKRLVSRLSIMLMGAFIANALILINSRGAIIAAAISLSYFMLRLFGRSKIKNQKKIAFLLVLIGISGLYVLIDEGFIRRVQSIFVETEVVEERETAMTRTVFWSSAIDLAIDHPMGTGYLGFDYYAPIYLPQGIATGKSRNRSVHSTWFEVLSEAGFHTLIIFLFMLRSCYVALKRCKERLYKIQDYENWFKIIALEGAWVSFLFTMTFLNRFRAEILYWLVLFSALALNIYYLKENDKKEKD